MKKTNFTILFLILLLLPVFSSAMKSETYQVDADTINAGGNLSGSTSYHLGDSAGEAATGEERSANYKSKTAFWYMLPEGSQLGLTCESSTVYMMDYSLGDINNYSKYTYSTSQECVVTDNTSSAWTLTAQSTNMTGAKNTLSNANIKLVTDGTAGSGDTITDPTTGITESSANDYSLDSPRTIISGDVTASGTYNNRPTIKLTNLNGLFAETISGTVTIIIQ
jgi:hypothetical protein